MLHLLTLEQLINNHWHLEILAFVPSATCEGNVSKSRQSILSVTFATYIQLLILVWWSFAFISLILICIRVFLLGINGQRGGRDQGGGSILPHSKYNDNATTLRLPSFNRKPPPPTPPSRSPFGFAFQSPEKVRTHTIAGVVVKETNSLWILKLGKWIGGIWPKLTVSVFYSQKMAHQEQSNDQNNKIRVLIFLIGPALIFSTGIAKSFNIFGWPSREF